MNLVPNRWYAILDSREVPSGSPSAFRRMGRDLVFWRNAAGEVRAADDRCPHRGAAMSIGTVSEGCLTCPFHGFRFDDDGACTHIPAHPDRSISPKMRLATMPVREAHGLVWAWSGPEAPDAGPIPFFDFEGYTWTGSQFTAQWPVHYSRAIENQLDWAHLGFVHHNTIGRLAPVEVDVGTEVDGDRIRSWLRNGNDGQIDFIGPNIWNLDISQRNRGFLAFAPIDDETMIYYSRLYQNLVTAPILDGLFGRVNRWVNQAVLAQDERIVSTQLPRISSLSNGEIYVRSDQPIIAYLRWREGLRGERPVSARAAAS